MRCRLLLLAVTLLLAGCGAGTDPVSPSTGAAATAQRTVPASQPLSAVTASHRRSPASWLRVGVVNTTGWGVDSTFTKIGVTWTRLDIGRGSDISILTKALGNGMNPLPLYASGPDGNLTGLSPAQCAADITALAPRLKALGISELEFGNEVYHTESAATYAAQYHAAHVAIAGMGIKLLATATTDSYDRARGGSGNWFLDLAAALPGGAAEVDAFTLHPYGSMTSTCSDGYGWPMMSSLHAESVDAGFSSTLPWYITEVGQEVSGNGVACQATVSPQVQAADVTQYLNDIYKQYPWVVFVSFYTSRDDGSGGFGLLNSDNSPRLAFTALQRWVTANASNIDG